jgi:hypothetical protein
MTADECRREAQECLARAEAAKTPHDKAAWLKIATEWMKLAEAANGQTPSSQSTDPLPEIRG